MKMNKIWTILRQQPATATIGALLLTLLGGTTGTAGYWVYMQEDPQIVTAEPPIPNAGVDADGVNYTQWINSGQPALEWKPVPKTTFKAGETLWTLRHDCFLHKTSGPITRVFRGGTPNGVIRQLDMLYPPTRTNGCKRANFATPIPADLPPGEYTYEVAVLFYKNMLQPEVRAQFADVAITVTK